MLKRCRGGGDAELQSYCSVQQVQRYRWWIVGATIVMLRCGGEDNVKMKIWLRC